MPVIITSPKIFIVRHQRRKRLAAYAPVSSRAPTSSILRAI
jgi:hypothetical protein